MGEGVTKHLEVATQAVRHMQPEEHVHVHEEGPAHPAVMTSTVHAAPPPTTVVAAPTTSVVMAAPPTVMAAPPAPVTSTVMAAPPVTYAAAPVTYAAAPTSTVVADAPPPTEPISTTGHTGGAVYSVPGHSHGLPQ